ncbi:GNAT family N-acetyltransferase [Brevibacillus daliensis]|uniref:GNAT family N-acetyltransferase n=1 Tax=Brevibacillus daliensis TaxID=2892995 RepID=UPI001E599AC0|nr:GNAT family N-acetyltransferase [Brevibacillus daliensis]
MQLFITDMSEDFAVQILNWKYDAPYDFYNNEENAESMKELLENTYYAVVDGHGNLFGFFCVGGSAQVPVGSQFGAYSGEQIDIGIGMKPAATGQGNGYSYFSFILHHVENSYSNVPMRLTVAEFNHRAIHLYEKLGFSKKMEFQNGPTTFITMVRKL